MSILVGDKESLALECVCSNFDKHLGRLFLYVSGVRFGETEFDYEVDEIILSVLKNFKLEVTNFFGLLKCPTKSLFSSYDVAWENDIGVDESVDVKNIVCEADKYLPNFIEHYSNSDALDNCVFRNAIYAFDRCTIILITSGKQVRLLARDDDNGQGADVITPVNEFINLWRELANIKKLGKATNQ